MKGSPTGRGNGRAQLQYLRGSGFCRKMKQHWSPRPFQSNIMESLISMQNDAKYLSGLEVGSSPLHYSLQFFQIESLMLKTDGTCRHCPLQVSLFQHLAKDSPNWGGSYQPLQMLLIQIAFRQKLTFSVAILTPEVTLYHTFKDNQHVISGARDSSIRLFVLSSIDSLVLAVIFVTLLGDAEIFLFFAGCFCSPFRQTGPCFFVNAQFRQHFFQPQDIDFLCLKVVVGIPIRLQIEETLVNDVGTDEGFKKVRRLLGVGIGGVGFVEFGQGFLPEGVYRKVILFVHAGKIYYYKAQFYTIFLPSFNRNMTSWQHQRQLTFFGILLILPSHSAIELYRRTMEGKEQHLDSTTGFINYKCKKDHLKNSPLLPHRKADSLYHNDYHTAAKPKPLADHSNLIGKERNSPAKHETQNVGIFGSNYKASYENHDSPKPIRMKEKSSFFLKHDNYEPPISTYNRMSILNKRGGEFSLYEKAKPRGDNLSVPKYNRMNSSSIYKSEFEAPVKLPLIPDRKNGELVRSSTQKYKISKIF